VARVDLDARRAQQEDHVVVLDGAEYRLPARLPLVVAEEMVAGNFRVALTGMFGEAQSGAVVDAISLDDLLAIARECYGLTPPESLASSPPSPGTGMRSTPTSSGTTG
jgi:hypothetical protein